MIWSGVYLYRFYCLNVCSWDQFLIRTGSVGRNMAEASLERAQNLNPMVDVKVDTENIEKKPESFFTQFDAVSFIENVKSTVGIKHYLYVY